MSEGELREALSLGAAGAGLGAAAGSLVGLTVPGALAGGLNGVVSGWRRIYDYRTVKGAGAFVLDSTWALATTTAGLVCHAVAAVQSDAGFAPELSERRNRHVYARGFRPRRGFAISVGNVVNGAGDVASARRRKLVTDHEDVHVWQARAFGPAFPVLYGGWMIGGGITGAAVWLAGRRDAPLGKLVETCGYYLNPFEWWAYSRDGNWPPRGKVAGVGWRRPLVATIASRSVPGPRRP